MVDARGGGLLQHRFGVEGDAEAGSLDHRQIVGAVADRKRSFGIEPEARAQFAQRLELGLAAENRFRDFSGQPSIRIGQQRVGALLVEPDRGGELDGKGGEAAGHHAGVSAIGAHRGDERRAARRQTDALGQHGIDDRGRQSLEQRHALAQRRRESDFAAHGALGDLGNLAFDAGIIGELVDALLADHG